MPQLDWIVGTAPNYDLVVVAGDSLNIASSVPLDVQSVVILEYIELLKSKVRIAVSSGNHDLTGPDLMGEQSALWLDAARASNVPIDGDSMRIDGTLVTICPWWDGPLGRAAVAEQLANDSLRRPRRWIWVYHWPPLGSPTCWTGRRSYGDEDVGVWIDEHRPDFVLAGHVHESPFKMDGSWVDRIGRTWVFNAGHQSGPVPAHVDLDLDAGTATWRSLLGTEVCRLADLRPPSRAVF